MNKLISTDEVAALAKDFGIELNILKAVMIVESSNRGFDPRTGKILIQFEPFHFKRMTKAVIENGVEGQTKEWQAFEKAAKINLEVAQKSTSWGLGQIMGFNYELAGYDTVHKMVNEFQLSEYFQVKGMLNFIKSRKLMYTSLQRKEWATFAKLYNGPQYKKFNYDTKLAEAYSRINGTNI